MLMSIPWFRFGHFNCRDFLYKLSLIVSKWLFYFLKVENNCVSKRKLNEQNKHGIIINM